jgi:hypothetical protein
MGADPILSIPDAPSKMNDEPVPWKDGSDMVWGKLEAENPVNKTYNLVLRIYCNGYQFSVSDVFSGGMLRHCRIDSDSEIPLFGLDDGGQNAGSIPVQKGRPDCVDGLDDFGPAKVSPKETERTV